ncbi:hypothetical protein FHW20_002749 [Ochrobactrum intermedium]|uniref:Uncharacterized protein n=1 Tax=Brucella intermedia TaxID=94625 RepID=A0ABR6AQQ5_9HYPH|nr:hypothetical protein [Brucella intermedia]
MRRVDTDISLNFHFRETAVSVIGSLNVGCIWLKCDGAMC